MLLESCQSSDAENMRSTVESIGKCSVMIPYVHEKLYITSVDCAWLELLAERNVSEFLAQM